jgi:hypothetical protein
MITGHKYHDDMQGILQTALTGVTQYTMRQYRTTGIVLPHIAQGDIFSMTFQMSHRKTLGVNMDGVHIHFIPIASADGDIQIDYEWGWYRAANLDTVPATLPNTGNKVITLATTDQYVLKIDDIVENMAAPSGEDYSSILFVKCTRVAPAGTNWGANNEIALVYFDGHMPINRYGSYNEYDD